MKTEDPTQWFEDVIDKRYDVYREWALKYMCEAPEEVLWRRWLAYDCDPELIRAMPRSFATSTGRPRAAARWWRAAPIR